MTVFIASLVAVAVLVAVHLFSGKLRFLDGTPRSIWLSLAGGISVAYVFVHLLPELAEGEEAVAEAAGEGLAFLDVHVYLVALIGLATFYGLDRLASESRRRNRKAGGADHTGAGVFWIHMGSFALYNVLTGYLLLNRPNPGVEPVALFGFAMAVHFVVNDYGLRRDHKWRYHRFGRWIISLGVVLGWTIGVLTDVPEATIAVLTAFLAGGIVMNVLKEELPEERRSRFWAFAVGAASYAALLLVAT